MADKPANVWRTTMKRRIAVFAAMLGLWAIGHFAAVWAAKRDPQFVDVVRRHLRIPGHLSA